MERDRMLVALEQEADYLLRLWIRATGLYYTQLQAKQDVRKIQSLRYRIEGRHHECLRLIRKLYGEATPVVNEIKKVKYLPF